MVNGTLSPGVPRPTIGGLVTCTHATPTSSTRLASIVAWIWVEEEYVVGTTVPFQTTRDGGGIPNCPPFVNPLPFTVRVKVPNWLATEAGEIDVIEGGFVIVKLAVPDAQVEPYASPFETWIDAVPAAATKNPSTAAVSWVALTKVVGRAAPFHRTLWLLWKFDPLTVSANDAAPEIAEAGEIDEIAGGARMVKVSSLERQPSPLTSRTETGPGLASIAALAVK